MKRTLLILALLVTLAPAVAAEAAPSVVGAVNAERAERGLAPLKRSKSLARSATRYARYLMRADVFRHPPRLWIASRFRLRGETLALHYGVAAARRVPGRRTVVLWLGSPPHRAILLHRRMRYAGVGQTRGRFNGRRAVIRVLHAAR